MGIVGLGDVITPAVAWGTDTAEDEDGNIVDLDTNEIYIRSTVYQPTLEAMDNSVDFRTFVLTNDAWYHVRDAFVDWHREGTDDLSALTSSTAFQIKIGSIVLGTLPGTAFATSGIKRMSTLLTAYAPVRYHNTDEIEVTITADPTWGMQSSLTLHAWFLKLG